MLPRFSRCEALPLQHGLESLPRFVNKITSFQLLNRTAKLLQSQDLLSVGGWKVIECGGTIRATSRSGGLCDDLA